MDRERIGKYTIVGELGRGTMGEVYKAHDPVLNRFVALKTLPARLGPDDETLQRFQREAQAAALLNHPNIVTVHDFGEQKGLLYMAMELLEGIDLREAIDGGLLKTLDEKLSIMDSTLAALDYAHAKGVVHRDIKPANIHLGKSRVVKIMDFGLARVSTSEMTQEGIVLGTPNYMSPEQALGDKVDGRSDIFSTGAVLYELLTGHKPFEAETTPSVLFQVVHKQPPPVRRWAPDMPGAVVAVVNRALEKDLERRFASAGDMRAALAIAREGLAPARPAALPPPVPKQAPPPRTRPAPPPLPPSAAPPAKPQAPVPPPVRPPDASALAAGTPGGESQPAGRRASLRPLLLGAGAAALALVIGATALWLSARQAPASAPTAAATAAATDELTLELVRKQLRLARAELDNKNYRAAIAEAEGVLKLAPGHPDARALISAAHDKLDELDRSLAEARRLAEAGDGASRAEAETAAADVPTAGDSAAKPRATPAPRPAATARASVPEPAPPTPPPSRGFSFDATSVSPSGSGGPAGFDSAQLAGRAPQFSGRMEFEVLPPSVRPGEPFVVRIHLRNEGRKSVKIRGLALAAVVDGQRVPASAVPLLKEVQAQSRGLVAEYSGVWGSPREWALEAVVTADKDEKLTSRLKAN